MTLLIVLMIKFGKAIELGKKLLITTTTDNNNDGNTPSIIKL